MPAFSKIAGNFAKNMVDFKPVRSTIATLIMEHFKVDTTKATLIALELTKFITGLIALWSNHKKKEKRFDTTSTCILTNLCLNLATFYVLLFDLKNDIEQIREWIEGSIGDALSDDYIIDPDMEQPHGVDSIQILAKTYLELQNKNSYINLLQVNKDIDINNALIQEWDKTYPNDKIHNIKSLVEIYAEYINNVPEMLCYSDILTRVHANEILHHLVRKVDKEFCYKAMENGLLVPDVYTSHTMNVGNNIITNTSLPLALGIDYPGSLDDVLQQLSLDFSINLEKPSDNIYRMPVLNGVNLDCVANNHDFHIQITDVKSGIYDGMKYLQPTGTYRTYNQDGKTQKVLYYDIENDVYHPSIFIPPLSLNANGIQDAFQSLASKWPKMVSWVLMIGVGILGNKFFTNFDVGKTIKKGISGFTQLSLAKKQMKEFEDFVMHDVLCIATEEDKIRDRILDVEKELNQFLVRPTSDYYMDPYLLTQLEDRINIGNDLYVNAPKTIANTTFLLVNTLTLAKNLHKELVISMSGRSHRQVPTTILIFGKEGVGKTTACYEMANRLAREHQWDKDDKHIYSFKTSKYWPKYRQEPIGVTDECFTAKNIENDILARDANSLISSLPYNMEGAALETKMSPNNFKYLIMACNPTPQEIMHKLPIERSGVAAFWSRFIIYEAVYNQGVEESKKDRENRKRLPNCGHVDFHRVTYHDHGNPSKKLNSQFQGDTENFSVDPDPARLDEVLEVMKRKFAQHSKNYKTACEIKQSIAANGKSINHFVINFNGLPNCGKTEAINTIAESFCVYDIPIHEIQYPDIPTLTTPSVVKVDDQVLMDGKTIDVAREQWYMQLYNTLPNNCIILIGTNIEMEYKYKLRNAFQLLQGGKLTNKICKNPFKNVGVLRRMGYCGMISSCNDAITHNLEFRTNTRGYKNVEDSKYYMLTDIITLAHAKYKKFLDIFDITTVKYVETLPPAFVHINIVGNETIMKEIKSKISIYKMLNGGTKNGNKIDIDYSLMEVTQDLDPLKLIPSFELEYNIEKIIDVAKFYLKILRPLIPDVCIKIQCTGLPIIFVTGNTINVVVAPSEENINLEDIDAKNGNVVINVHGETFKINIDKFDSAMESKTLILEFRHLPMVVVEFTKNLFNNPSRYPLLQVALRNCRRARIINKNKLKAITISKKNFEFLKSVDIYQGFLGVCVGLTTIAALWDVFSRRKNNAVTVEHVMRFDPKLELELEFEHAMRRKKELNDTGAIERFQEKFDVNATELNSFIAERKKGKNKKMKRNVVAMRKQVDSRGRIWYVDNETGEVVGYYDRLEDRFYDYDNVNHLYDQGDIVDIEDRFMEEYGSFRANVLCKKIMRPKVPSLVDSVSTKVYKNMVYVCNIYDKRILSYEVLNEEDALLGAQMTGVGLKEGYIIAPRHLIAGCKFTDIMLNDGRYNTKTSQWFRCELVWQATNIDIAIWKVVSKQFQPFADITKFIGENKPPDTAIRTMLLDCTSNPPDRYFGKVYTRLTPASYELEIGGKNTIIKSSNTGIVNYAGSAFPVTLEGSCGFPYFSLDEKDHRVFVGIHVASNGHCVDSEPYAGVVQLLVPEILDVLATFKAESSNAYMDEHTKRILVKSVGKENKFTPLLPTPQCDSVKIMGTTCERVDNLKIKNPIVPTYHSSQIESLVPIMKVPAILDYTKLTAEEVGKLDKDGRGNPSSIATQENMWSDPLPVGPSHEHIEKLKKEMQPWMNMRWRNYRVLTESEIMSGINDKNDPLYGFNATETDTSAGYVIQQTFNVKKKSDLISTNPVNGTRQWRNNQAAIWVKESILDLDLAIRCDQVPVLIYKNVPKYEKLPIHKRWKTRIFTIPDMRQIYLEKKYFGAYVQTIINSQDDMNCVGIRPEGFNTIAQRSIALGNCASLDFTRYDKHIHEKMNHAMSHMYKTAALTNGATEEEANAIFRLSMNADCSTHITMNTFYKKNRGLCSGSYNTESKNSDYNVMYFFDAWMNLVPSEYRSWRSFMEYVLLRVYGDDVHITVHKRFEKDYSVFKISKYLLDTWGMQLDSANKDGKKIEYGPLKESMFISRHFRELRVRNGTPFWVGSLKKESISGLLHFTKSHHPSHIASLLSDAMWESVGWGRRFYDDIIKCVKHALREYKFLHEYLTLMSYDEILLQVYNDHFNGNGTKPFVFSIAHTTFSEEFDPETEYKLQANMQSANMDYVSQLNRMWQSNRITMPEYTFEEDLTTVKFIMTKRNGEKVPIQASTNVGLCKNWRKNEAAHQAVLMCRKKQDESALEAPEMLDIECVEPKRMRANSKKHIAEKYNRQCEEAKKFVDNYLQNRKEYDQKYPVAKELGKIIDKKVQEKNFKANMDRTAQPATMKTTVKTTSDSSHPPVDVFPMATHDNLTPSVTLNGAGEIAQPNNCAVDTIHLNSAYSIVDDPVASGRPMSLETLLWQNYAPLDSITVSSDTNEGDLIFKMSANPLDGASPKHKNYASLYNSAVFANENLIIINSATNIAGSLLFGWVRDISKTKFTIEEAMATDWTMIDLNGNKTLKLKVTDARQTKFYRKLTDTDDVPGIVCILLSKLNNMYATSDTFTIRLQRYQRFAQETMFFDPVEDNVVASPLDTRVKTVPQIPLSLFSKEPFQIFVGSKSMPQWNDENQVQDFCIYNSRFHGPNGTVVLPINVLTMSYDGRHNADNYNSYTLNIYLDGYYPPNPDVWKPTATQEVTITTGSTDWTPKMIFGGTLSLADLTFDDPTYKLFWYTDTNKKIRYTLTMTVQVRVVDAHFEATRGEGDNATKYEALDETTKDTCIPQSRKEYDFVEKLGDLTWKVRARFNDVKARDNCVIGIFTGLKDDQEGISIQLGECTVEGFIPLSNKLKYLNFIAQNQSGLNNAQKTLLPLPSILSEKINQYIAETYNSEFVEFEIHGPTGRLLTLNFWRNTGFIVVSGDENIVSPALTTDSLFITNIRETSTPTATIQNDFSNYGNFTPNGRYSFKANMLALAGGALSGIGAGFSAWQDTRNLKMSLQNQKDIANIYGQSRLNAIRENAEQQLKLKGITSFSRTNSNVQQQRNANKNVRKRARSAPNNKVQNEETQPSAVEENTPVSELVVEEVKPEMKEYNNKVHKNLPIPTPATSSSDV